MWPRSWREELSSNRGLSRRRRPTPKAEERNNVSQVEYSLANHIPDSLR